MARIRDPRKDPRWQPCIDMIHAECLELAAINAVIDTADRLSGVTGTDRFLRISGGSHARWNKGWGARLRELLDRADGRLELAEKLRPKGARLRTFAKLRTLIREEVGLWPGHSSVR